MYSFRSGTITNTSRLILEGIRAGKEPLPRFLIIRPFCSRTARAERMVWRLQSKRRHSSASLASLPEPVCCMERSSFSSSRAMIWYLAAIRRHRPYTSFN